MIQPSVCEPTSAAASLAGTAATSELKEASDLEITEATSIISPCKASPLFNKNAATVSQEVHQLDQVHEAVLPSNEQHPQLRNYTELAKEVDDSHFPILEMMESIESMDSDGINTEGIMANECVPCGYHASNVEAACRAAAAAVAGELVTVNDDTNTLVTGRYSASLAFRHSPDMMKFPVPHFEHDKSKTYISQLTIQHPPDVVDFDCSNIEHFLGEKGSFDSSRCEDGEQGTPLRRRHSLDITSPHDGNFCHKRLKHSLSLPYESGHDYAQLTAPWTSIGSNTSDLTPIAIRLTPRMHNQILSHKPNSSPVSIILPPTVGVTNIFQNPPTSSANVFLQPRANSSNFLSRDTNSRDIQQVTSTPSVDDANRQKIILPPRLVPEDTDGRRLQIIFGSSKQCTATSLDNLDAASQNLTKQRNLVILTNPNLIKDRALTGYEQLYFLVAIYPALQGFTFLLPGLKKSMSEKNPCSIPGLKIRVSSLGSFKLGCVKVEDEHGPTASELAIAKRRIACAICAFGGYVKGEKGITNSESSSIFRVSSVAKSQRKMRRKANAVKVSSRNRYFDNGVVLSWEVESNISFDKKDLDRNEKCEEDERKIERMPSTLSRASSMDQSESSKKYKCRLCGQLKQSHVCPFRQTVLRNIGVMVYPSANAYAANEPGMLAPSLCDMNNFVLLGSQSFDTQNFMSFDGLPSGTILDNTVAAAFERKGIAVDATKSKPLQNLNQMINSKYRMNELRVSTDHGSDDGNAFTNSQSGLLFRPTMELTNEQYRIVSTPSGKSKPSKRASYTYPHVPMTHVQRKSMSDKLFRLSKNIEGLTKECKLVLIEARKGENWDLAVAELMTQVVCIVYCSGSNDFKLDGLSQYLLQLGICC
ncbi:hypothetical protein ACHAW6_011120 [Cyclotella cf. meneghiniana]